MSVYNYVWVVHLSGGVYSTCITSLLFVPELAKLLGTWNATDLPHEVHNVGKGGSGTHTYTPTVVLY